MAPILTPEEGVEPGSTDAVFHVLSNRSVHFVSLQLTCVAIVSRSQQNYYGFPILN